MCRRVGEAPRGMQGARSPLPDNRSEPRPLHAPRRRARAPLRDCVVGFTLLEVVVALGVTAVLLAALATAVPGVLRARGVATERLERATVVRTVLLHLERELAGAVAEPFAVMAAGLEFTGGGEPGERLSYTVEHAALVRRATVRFAPADSSAPGVPLVDGVAAMTVDAFDGRDWVTPWRDRTPPEAVRIRLQLDDGETASTIVSIPTARRRAS